MTVDFDFVIDGPANFFGNGRCSKGCYTREGFNGLVKAYRDLGKTVHVHENHHPVYAVIEPSSKPAPAFDVLAFAAMAKGSQMARHAVGQAERRTAAGRDIGEPKP